MKAVCVMASASRKIAMRGVQMHKSSMLRMEWFCKTYMQNFKIPATIVDFGSQCIPGQRDTYKTFFQDKSKFNYVGVDMAKVLVAKKPKCWQADDFTLTNYFCEPADLNRLATGFIPFEKQPYFKKYLIIKTLFESLKKYWKALKRITTHEKGYF